MHISQLHAFLTAPVEKTVSPNQRLFNKSPAVVLWFGLSLVFAAFYGVLALEKAFRAEYVVQDDAREYVFWMQRFIDPDLFPQDLIANYFQSITPAGYAAVYDAMAGLGITPLIFSKILPIVLGLITTVYCFGVSFQIIPVPITAFISSLLLNQSLWFKSDLASATPKAFIYPLLLAFFYYLIRRSNVGIGVTIVLQGLIYPPLVLISMGIVFLRLGNWKRLSPLFETRQGGVRLCILVFGLGVLTMLPYALTSGEFGPVITAAQAKTMPELWPGGRHPYFSHNPWRFWLIGQHSGILPPLMPPLIWVGLSLPFLLKYPSRFPLTNQIKGTIAILTQTVMVSLGLFFAAHALLLKLFFPTRYTIHTFRVVMAIAAGIALTILLDAALNACERLLAPNLQSRQFGIILLTVAIGAVLVLYPNLSPQFPATNNRVSGNAELYQFLQKQPKNSVIATLAAVANDIPTFAQRPVLISEETALPFHIGYYNQIRQRSIDLIRAQYSSDMKSVQQFIQKYDVSFWITDQNTFTQSYLTSASWLRSFQPAFDEALTRLHKGTVPALATLKKQCSVLETQGLTVLDTECIVRAKEIGNGQQAMEARSE